MENIIRYLNLTSGEVFFYRTHNGTELDLFWLMRGKNYGAEIRFSDTPAITKSMKISIHDLKLSHLWVIYPGTKKIRTDEMITILPFSKIEDILSNA